jgi:hypothetical protein
MKKIPNEKDKFTGYFDVCENALFIFIDGQND